MRYIFSERICCKDCVNSHHFYFNSKKVDSACNFTCCQDIQVDVALSIIPANDLLPETVVILSACLAAVTGAGAWLVRPDSEIAC